MSVQIRFGSKAKGVHGFALNARIRASIRHTLADEIGRLLNLIDALDNDLDLELSGDDKPSLGGTITIMHGTIDDAEQGEVSS